MTFTTACPDWERRIVEGESLIPFPPLFPDEAASALEVFNELRLVDVLGKPTMGEACRPWITEFVASVFGAYDAESGRRQIQEWLLAVSKKNSKSTLAAGIMLTALIRNWRHSAEFLVIAPTIEIANNSFFPARDMVRANEQLSALLHIQDHYRTITHRGNGALLKVVAADNETVGGKKATGVLVDELWLLGKQPNAENMLREATGGLASRPEGFTIFLTTQSDSPPAGVFWSKLQYARGVRDGRIKDNKFLPVLYEHPPAMLKDKSYRDPKNFFVTNPNLGASVDREFLEREAGKATNDGEASMCGFFSKHLNVEIGTVLNSDRWSGADYWEVQARTPWSLDELIARSEVVCCGVDGGGLDDLLGFGAIGRDSKTREWLVWTHAWAHPSVLERRKSEAPRFRDFARDGNLTLVEEIGDDTAEVAGLVAHIHKSKKLDKVGVDPHGLGTILDEIVAAKVPAEKVVGITQGYKMTGAIKTAERKLAEGGLIHGGQRMMAWCVGNAKIEQKGNAIIMTKQAAGTAKIDPLLAMLNAVSLMSLNPAAMGGKVQLLFV